MEFFLIMTMIEENDIDLRPLVLELIKGWQVLLLTATMLAVLGLVYSLNQPKLFKAGAVIIVTRSRVQMNFADQFPTINEPVDSRYRMDALLTIIQSDAIAYATFHALNAQLARYDLDFEKFRGLVQATSKGDALLIDVSAHSPDLAADIANTWANYAVETINGSFRVDQPLAGIQAQLSKAQSDYATAQNALEAFIQSSPIHILEQQITELSTLLMRLAGDRSKKLAYFSDRKITLEKNLAETEALKQQLDNNAQSNAAEIGDALAVLVARAYSSFLISNTADQTGRQDNANGFQINLQIEQNSEIFGSPNKYTNDINSLIFLFQEEIVKTDAAISSLKGESLDAAGYAELQPIVEKLNALETRLERENARRKELNGQRDLYFEAYQALAQKEAEIRNAAQSSNQVNLASPAVASEKPIPRGTVVKTLLAGVIGVIIGAIFVLGKNWWQSTGKIAQADSKPHSAN
jgi:capsular polysaccharide biosynthesis protein